VNYVADNHLKYGEMVINFPNKNDLEELFFTPICKLASRMDDDVPTADIMSSVFKGTFQL
jgi:hypothetical protein